MTEIMLIKNPFDKDLQTMRLIMRQVRESDDNDMFEYTCNPDITRYLSWEPHHEIAQARLYISQLIENYKLTDCYAWAIELKEFNKFIGIVRIFNVSFANKRGEISYILNPAFQGKGLAVEAIKAVIEFCIGHVGLNRIQARCTPDNYPSERVIQKLGMQYEGTLKEYWVNKGIFTDAKLYALTAVDFSQHNNINTTRKF